MTAARAEDEALAADKSERWAVVVELVLDLTLDDEQTQLYETLALAELAP